MDKKYIIDLDSKGLINYVGINTPEGLVIKKITDQDDATKYMNQMREINNEYGHFFRNYFDGKCEIASGRFFEEEMKKEYVKEEPVPEITEKVNSKSIKQIAALALAFIVGTSAIALAKDGNIAAKAKKVLGFKKQTTIQASDEREEENLENKTLDELINMLDEDGQQQAFNKIVDTQDYFNEVAAPTVRQGDKQLYLTFDETTSAYLYANAKAVSSEKLSSFFGKSKILLNEDGEYEKLDKESVAANYLSFCLNLSYYYQLGATETSGVSTLFENEEEAKLFNEFEAKILEYNKNKNASTKAEIRQMLEDIYMSGNIDSKMDKNAGASSIIGTAIVPYLYLEGIIDEDMYNSLVEINETLTCETIYNKIGKVVNCEMKENGKEEIIEEIARRQNQTVIGLDRNVDMTEAIDGYRKSDLDLGEAVTGYASGFKNSKTITKHVKKVTKNRSEAVKMTSEKQVKEAEKKADKEIQKKNEEENKRAEELIKENEKKDEENKQEQIKKYEEEHKNDQPKEVITEEIWVHEETPQNNNENDNSNNNHKEPKIVEEVIEDTHIYGTPSTQKTTNKSSNSESKSTSSSSSTQTKKVEIKEEVIEDTHIYGTKPDNSVIESKTEETFVEEKETTVSEPQESTTTSAPSQSNIKVVEEVIEDTHIYGEKPTTQKVVKIERQEEQKEEALENTEDTKVKVRQ